MPWRSCCGAKVAIDAQASCRRRAGVVALVVMVSSSLMHRHLRHHRDGVVSLVAMASLPLPMLRCLSIADDDGDGATGDDDDGNNDDDDATDYDVNNDHQKSNHVPYYLFIMIIHLGNMYYGAADTFLT